MNKIIIREPLNNSKSKELVLLNQGKFQMLLPKEFCLQITLEEGDSKNEYIIISPMEDNETSFLFLQEKHGAFSGSKYDLNSKIMFKDGSLMVKTQDETSVLMFDEAYTDAFV